MLRAMGGFIAAFAVAAGSGIAQRELTVSAAVSLTEALEAIAPVCADRIGIRVRYNFGASNVLARQIVRGAPADVFVSADEAQMDLVARAEAIAPDSRVDLLSNRLALVTAGRHLRDARDLLAPGVRRIAIGDPAAVPAGVYARKYLEAAGLWTAIEPKIVPVASVRAVAAAVQHGAADAGFVYESDASVAGTLRLAMVVPAHEGPKIVYPAAVLAASGRPADARRFIDCLRDAAATEIFKRFKFIPLVAGR